MKPGEEAGEAVEVPGRIRRQAAEWLALREARGFTTQEHADFSEWLATDVRHRAAFAEIAAGWRRMDGLAAYPHSPDAAPDPDLLATPARSRGWRSPATLGAAAAAVLALAAWFSWRAVEPADGRASVAQVAPRVLQLSDGSEVELNAGSEVSEHFTPAERHVRLVRGEAHFTVAKNPERPFVVQVGDVRLRALGTAFNVRFEASSVEVLVTHGRVQVEPADAGAAPASGGPMPVLEAQQRVVVPLAAAVRPAVETLEVAEMNRLLAWQTSRVAFENLPLAEVLARLRVTGHGPHTLRITVTDPRLAALRISGRVRADDVEGFVEVLETSFGVAADRRPDGEIVLRLR